MGLGDGMQMRLMIRPWQLTAMVVLLCPLLTRADSVTVNALPYTNVRIVGIKGDQFIFSTAGREIAKPLAQITRISVDGEAALNSAEQAFEEKDWNAATDNYERVFRTTAKPWLKQWCSVRLLESASRGGRFDSAVTAVISMAESSPESASAVSLKMPGADSAYLPQAVEQVNAALAKELPDGSKDVLLRLLVDLHKARNDAAGEQKAMQQWVELQVRLNPNSPEALRAAMSLKLKELRSAVHAGEYDRVIQTIQADAATMVEPGDQIEALLLIADAMAGKARASKDPAVWKDVAVAYIRVVANAPAEAPQVPAALLKVAEIHATRLEEKSAAAKLYRQVISEYKGQDAAEQAEKELAKLN